MLAIVVTALSTGLRKEQLRNLTWQEVDIEKGAIILSKTRTKNRTARRVPLRGKALELLQVAFAKRLGIAQSTLNRLENLEQSVTLHLIEKIADRLKVDVADLISD